MYNIDELIKQAKDGVTEYGSWFLDWGIASDIYKNCPTRRFADEVAAKLKADGYDIYIDRMGYGNKRVAEGTPVCYRIFKGDYPRRAMDEW